MKVAINGFGRIGRLVFRIMEDDPSCDIIAINDLTDAEQLAYLLKYDTNHGNFKVNEISYDDDCLIIGDRKVKVLKETDPLKLPWEKLGVDVVFECTGRFTNKDDAYKHIEAGASKVIVSAPCKGDVKTIVYNVNHDTLDGSEKVISAASCTTNCLAPVLNILDNEFGVVSGTMTTIHAYTNDQVTLDVAHKKGILSRRGRACAQNIVPSSTGAASAIGKVIPNLDGKLDGFAMRVPVGTGSVIDLTLELKEKVDVDKINNAFYERKNETVNITMDPIVSSDIIGSSYGALVDGLLTNVIDVDGKQIVKVVAWYDNEFSYSYQMVRTVKYFANLK